MKKNELKEKCQEHLKEGKTRVSQGHKNSWYVYETNRNYTGKRECKSKKGISLFCF